MSKRAYKVFSREFKLEALGRAANALCGNESGTGVYFRISR